MTDVLLDPDTVARVIHRASAFSEVRADGRHSEGVSVEALIEAATEVGIPATAVRRALAHERLDPVPATHPADGIVGPATVTVDAEVAGSAIEALTHLDAWLVHGHHLRRDRLRDGRGQWTKRTGVVGAVVRVLRSATGEGRLGREVRVSASTAETGAGTAVVRLAVDRAGARQALIVAGAAVALVGGATAIAMSAAFGPLFLALFPVGVAAGFGVAGAGRRQARAVAGEIERVLDALDECRAPTPLRVDLARRAVAARQRAGSGFRASRIL